MTVHLPLLPCDDQRYRSFVTKGVCRLEPDWKATPRVELLLWHGRCCDIVGESGFFHVAILFLPVLLLLTHNLKAD